MIKNFSIQNYRHSQIGFEFLLLTSFLFVVLAIIVGVIGFFISGFNEDRLDREREEFVQTIIREFENALSSPNSYRRGFLITQSDLRLFNVTFMDGTPAIIIEDFRKHGPNSDVTYYYELGNIFLYQDNFFSELITDTSDPDFGGVRITFDLEKLIDSDRITLSPSSMVSNFNQILLYTSLTPGNNFPVSLGQIFDIGLSSNIVFPHYSFIDYDNTLVGWWRFENFNSQLIFEENFDTFDGWEQYLNGQIEHSNEEEARFGTYSLKKTGDNNPNGGFKVLGFELDRDFIFEYWIKSEDPRISGVNDRISLQNSDNEGYGVLITPDAFSIERVFNNSLTFSDAAQTIVAPGVSWTRPENQWYRVRLESRNDGFLNASIYLHDGTLVGSVTTTDSDFNSFDRIGIRGGYNYFVDGIRIYKNVFEDESGNSNHAINRGATVIEDGAFGRAVEFTAGHTIEVISSPEILDLNKEFTVSLWVNTTMNSDQNQYFIDRLDSTNNERVWGILLRGGQDYASVLTSHIGSDAIYLEGSTTINNGEWHHLVMVHDGEMLRFYVNGELENEAPTIELHDSNTPLRFGRSPNIETQLDDIIIFSRVLNNLEVQALYNSTALTYSNQFLKASLGNVSFQGLAVDINGNKINAQRRTLNFLNPLFYINPTPFNNTILRLGQSDISIHLNDSIANEYYSFVNIDNSLVGWWRFDEFAPIRGVRFSGGEELVYHQFYNTYFSNSIFRGFSPSNSRHFNGNASYSIWIRPEGNFNGAYIFTDRNTNEGQIRLFTNPNHEIRAIWGWGSANEIIHPFTFNFGEWIHLGMTHERNDAEDLYYFRLYVNGEEVGVSSRSISTSVDSYGPDNALRIGRGFRGVISEVQIYEEVLREDDFKQLYLGNVFTNKDLVLYLDFEEDDAIIDKSPNNFQHTQGDDFISILEGPSSTTNALQIGKDYQVALSNVYGNSHLLRGTSPSTGTNFNGNATYSIWFRPEGDFSGGYLFVDNNINEGLIQIFENRVRARWASGTVINYDTVIEEGQWYHVAMTHERVDADDRYYFRLYLNGVEVGSDSRLISTSTSIYGPENTFRIGPEFEGKMSNVQIHDRVLTTTEIQNMFNNYEIITDGIVILYDFQGDTLEEQLRDKSGNDRHIPFSSFTLGLYDFEYSFLDESGFNNSIRSFRASKIDDGKFGGTIEFDGTSYAIISSEMLSEVHNSGTVTYSLWFNSSSNDNSELLFRGSASGSPIIGEIGCIYEPIITTRDVRLSGCTETGRLIEDITDTPPILVNDWNHLAVSIDESNNSVLIYLNGEKINTRNISDVRGDSTRSYAILNQDSSIIDFLILGGWFGDDIITPSFVGSIDELLIFNRSLSSSELFSLYSSSSHKYRNDFVNLPIGSEQYQGIGVNEDAVVVSTEIRTLNFLDPLFYVLPLPSDDPMLTLNNNNREIGLNDSISNNYYSFVNFDDSLVGWWRFEKFGTKRGILLRRDQELYFEQFYNTWHPNSVFLGISPANSNQFNANASYSAWILPKGDFNGGRIFTDNNNNEGYIQINENSIVAYWGGSSSISHSIDINREEWYHVGMTHEKNDSDDRYYFKLYVNGELVGMSEEEISSSSVFYGPDNRLRIGTNFEGVISDVRIFERVLTDNDFQRIYSLQHIYEEDLVLYLDFEESFGVFDRSGNNRNSPSSISEEFPFKQGPNPFSDAIFIDKSTHFDIRNIYGSGRILEGVSPSNPSEYNGNLSLSMWFKPERDFNGGTLFTDSNFNEAHIQIFSDRIYVRWDGTNEIEYFITIEEGEWYHIIVTHEMDITEDEYRIRLYLDGVLVDSSSRLISNSSSVYGPEGVMRIGAEFEGWISEIQVYNRVLNPSQVQNIFEASLEDLEDEVTYPGLVMFYDFRGSNIRNRLRDKSGNNFHLPSIEFEINDYESNRITKDESGNNLRGVIVGATSTADGKFGKAMEFERSNRDEIIITQGVDLIRDKSFTMSSWVYVDGSSTGHPPIFVNADLQGGSTHYNGFKFRDDGTTARFVLEREGESSFGTREIQFGLEPQTWNHIVGVYDRGRSMMSLYVNNELIDSVLVQGDVTIFDSFKIGGHRENNDFFNGKIDDVLIFNRVLFPSEISSLYNSTPHKYINNFRNILLRPTFYQGFGANIDGFKVNTPLRLLDFPQELSLRGRDSLQNDISINGASNLKIVGDVAYVVSKDSNSLSLFNVSDPSNIEDIGTYTVMSTALDEVHDLKVQDNLLLTVSKTTIVILNITNSGSLTNINAVTFASSADLRNNIEVDENYIYISSMDLNAGGFPPGFVVIDKSNLSNLEVLTPIILNDSYSYQRMAKSGNYIFQTINLEGVGGGIKIINVTDVNNPQVVQTFISSSLRDVFDIEIRDTTAFVSSFGKITSFDISNPSSIGTISSTYLGGREHRGISISDNFAAVTGYFDSKLKIVDINNPLNMRFIMEVENEDILSGISGVDFSNNCLFAVSQDSNTISSYSFLNMDC